MLQYFILKQKKICLLGMLILAGISLEAQTVKRVQPVWWFGASGAVNFNAYRGTTQMLNSNLTVPTAFHQGKSVRPYGSLLMEYRPGKVWGGMLNLAYDNRGGKFNDVVAPCNCPATLSTNLGYIAIEPSIRIAPFSNAFYIFAGPTININIDKQFNYTQEKQTDTRADWSSIRKTVVSAQAGFGIDIPVSKPTSETQMTISPFAAFQTDLFQSPRAVESWSVNTIRAGIAFKFGTGRKAAAVVPPAVVATLPGKTSIVKVIEKDVQFSVRAPKVVPLARNVKETFPLRNYVFFNTGSTEIPLRYVALTPMEATSFREAQLQEGQPDNLITGRSARQLEVYHNILNITGDRMRTNPSSTISLIGSSDKDPNEGRIMAEQVKRYLVSSFGIDESRISTEGRDKPLIPSEQPGGSKDMALLKEGDRRVDIVSTSPELLLQVGGAKPDFLRPVQISAVQADPLDSHVIFMVQDDSQTLYSWGVTITGDDGREQVYGPFYGSQASVSGNTILGNDAQGNYRIEMTGKTKDGKTIRKSSSVSLTKTEANKQEGLRYSILFDFDKSKTIKEYEVFLTDVIAPLIPENGTVIIHGHTDIIGDDAYNLTLSKQRALDAQTILQKALAKAGKSNVKFETFGFGEDLSMSPFDNRLPEERFYNRSVIIDIIQNK